MGFALWRCLSHRDCVIFSDMVFKNAHSVLSHATVMATRLRKVAWILEVAIPAVRDIDWLEDGVPCSARSELVGEILTWSNLPELQGHVDELLRALDPHFTPPIHGAGRTEWQTIQDSSNAFELARFLKRFEASEAPYTPGMVDLPEIRNCTPRKCLSECIRTGVTGARLNQALSANPLLHIFRPKKSSLKPMVAALNAWGGFCEVLNVQHFPVCVLRAAQFASVCRESSTYVAYLAHLKSACDFLGVPSDWADDARLHRAKLGLKKACLVFKGPKHAVSGELICRIADVSGVWVPCRFFVVFSWVFMLRAKKRGVFDPTGSCAKRRR